MFDDRPRIYRIVDKTLRAVFIELQYRTDKPDTYKSGRNESANGNGGEIKSQFLVLQIVPFVPSL